MKTQISRQDEADARLKGKFKVTFVWSAGFEIIEAKDLTQAKRIASTRYGKMNVSGVRQVKR